MSDQLGVTLEALDRLLEPLQPVVLDGGHIVPEWLVLFASLERAASRLQCFEPIVLPALLQTEAYAEAASRAGFRAQSDSDIAQQVALRIARQQVLERSPNPLDLACIVDESVLLRETEGPAVMANQLDHLVTMSNRPSIDLRILPLSSTSHAASFGAFQLLTSPESNGGAFMACAEDLSGIRYLDSPAAVAAHTQLFEHLQNGAYSVDQSADLIRSISRPRMVQVQL